MYRDVQLYICELYVQMYSAHHPIPGESHLLCAVAVVCVILIVRLPLPQPSYISVPVSSASFFPDIAGGGGAGLLGSGLGLVEKGGDNAPQECERRQNQH